MVLRKDDILKGINDPELVEIKALGETSTSSFKS